MDPGRHGAGLARRRHRVRPGDVVCQPGRPRRLRRHIMGSGVRDHQQRRGARRRRRAGARVERGLRGDDPAHGFSGHPGRKRERARCDHDRAHRGVGRRPLPDPGAGPRERSGVRLLDHQRPSAAVGRGERPLPPSRHGQQLHHPRQLDGSRGDGRHDERPHHALCTPEQLRGGELLGGVRGPHGGSRRHRVGLRVLGEPLGGARRPVGPRQRRLGPELHLHQQLVLRRRRLSERPDRVQREQHRHHAGELHHRR